MEGSNRPSRSVPAPALVLVTAWVKRVLVAEHQGMASVAHAPPTFTLETTASLAPEVLPPKEALPPYILGGGTIRVTLKHARELAAEGRGGSKPFSNPSVHLKIGSDKKHSFVSKTVTGTLNPDFEQSFDFETSELFDLLKQPLELHVVHKAGVNTSKSLGLASLNLIPLLRKCPKKLPEWNKAQDYDSLTHSFEHAPLHFERSAAGQGYVELSVLVLPMPLKTSPSSELDKAKEALKKAFAPPRGGYRKGAPQLGDIEFNGAGEEQLAVEQAWRLAHTEQPIAHNNANGLRALASVLSNHPRIYCRVHCMSDQVELAPTHLADAFGMHPSHDAGAIMDELARRRANACVVELHRLGVKPERVYATATAQGSGSSGGAVEFSLQLEAPPTVVDEPLRYSEGRGGYTSSAARTLAAQQEKGMRRMMADQKTRTPSSPAKIDSIVRPGMLGMQVGTLRLEQAVVRNEGVHMVWLEVDFVGLIDPKHTTTRKVETTREIDLQLTQAFPLPPGSQEQQRLREIVTGPAERAKVHFTLYSQDKGCNFVEAQAHGAISLAEILSDGRDVRARPLELRGNIGYAGTVEVWVLALEVLREALGIREGDESAAEADAPPPPPTAAELAAQAQAAKQRAAEEVYNAGRAPAASYDWSWEESAQYKPPLRERVALSLIQRFCRRRHREILAGRLRPAQRYGRSAMGVGGGAGGGAVGAVPLALSLADERKKIEALLKPDDEATRLLARRRAATVVIQKAARGKIARDLHGYKGKQEGHTEAGAETSGETSRKGMASIADVALTMLGAPKLGGNAVDEWRRWMEEQRQHAAALALVGDANHPYTRYLSTPEARRHRAPLPWHDPNLPVVVRLHARLPQLPVAAAARLARLENAISTELGALLSVEPVRLVVSCGLRTSPHATITVTIQQAVETLAEPEVGPHVISAVGAAEMLRTLVADHGSPLHATPWLGSVVTAKGVEIEEHPMEEEAGGALPKPRFVRMLRGGGRGRGRGKGRGKGRGLAGPQARVQAGSIAPREHAADRLWGTPAWWGIEPHATRDAPERRIYSRAPRDGFLDPAASTENEQHGERHGERHREAADPSMAIGAQSTLHIRQLARPMGERVMGDRTAPAIGADTALSHALGLSHASLASLLPSVDELPDMQSAKSQRDDKERQLRGRALRRALLRSAPGAPKWYTLAIEAMEATGHFCLDGRDGVPRSADLPPCTWAVLAIGYTGAVHSLSVCHLGLAALDRTIGVLAALVAIDVSGNNLVNLPESLGHLANLQRLDASHNQIAAVPTCVWDCAGLRHLTLSHNAIDTIEELPFAARCGPSLQQLDLSHNLLSAFPESFMELTRLTQLDLTHNRLASLPVAAVDLQAHSLQVLHLGANVAPPASLLVEAHVRAGCYLSVEFCTAPRPSVSLKGDSAKYLECFANVARMVTLLFDGAIPTVANPSRDDTVKPTRRALYDLTAAAPATRQPTDAHYSTRDYNRPLSVLAASNTSAPAGAYHPKYTKGHSAPHLHAPSPPPSPPSSSAPPSPPPSPPPPKFVEGASYGTTLTEQPPSADYDAAPPPLFPPVMATKRDIELSIDCTERPGLADPLRVHVTPIGQDSVILCEGRATSQDGGGLAANAALGDPVGTHRACELNGEMRAGQRYWLHVGREPPLPFMVHEPPHAYGGWVEPQKLELRYGQPQEARMAEAGGLGWADEDMGEAVARGAPAVAAAIAQLLNARSVDWQLVFEALSGKSAEQLQAVREAYQPADIFIDINRAGDQGGGQSTEAAKLATMLLLSRAECDVRMVDAAFVRQGAPDMSSLIEVVCTLTPAALVQLREAYAAAHSRPDARAQSSLAESIVRHMSDQPGKKGQPNVSTDDATPLLVSLLESAHEAELCSKPHAVHSDTQALKKALTKPSLAIHPDQKLIEDQHCAEDVVGVLACRTRDHRRAVREAFDSLMYPKTLAEVLRARFSGSMQRALLMLLESAEDYLAHKLHAEVHNAKPTLLHTVVDTVVEMLGSRFGRDLTSIMKAYTSAYSRNVPADLANRLGAAGKLCSAFCEKLPTGGGGSQGINLDGLRIISTDQQVGEPMGMHAPEMPNAPRPPVSAPDPTRVANAAEAFMRQRAAGVQFAAEASQLDAKLSGVVHSAFTADAPMSMDLAPTVEPGVDLSPYPRLGAFEVVLRSPGGLFLPLHSKVETQIFPSVERLGSRLLTALGQPSTHLILLRDEHHLHRAAAGGHVLPLRRLLHAAAHELEAADDRGKRPVHYASMYGHADCVRLLLQHRAQHDAADLEGRTPLVEAAAKGHADVVSVLLAARARANMRDHTGSSPLHHAVQAGSLSCAKLLVEEGGAARVCQDGRNRTPLDLALDPVLAARSVHTTRGLKALLSEQPPTALPAPSYEKPTGALEAHDSSANPFFGALGTDAPPIATPSEMPRQPPLAPDDPDAAQKARGAEDARIAKRAALAAEGSAKADADAAAMAEKALEQELAASDARMKTSMTEREARAAEAGTRIHLASQQQPKERSAVAKSAVAAYREDAASKPKLTHQGESFLVER